MATSTSTTDPTPQDLPIITIPPSNPALHTHTVIFLHGRGDNTKSFTRALHAWTSSQGLTLFDAFPTIHWVFPQAPLRPVASTANQFPQHICPQWFDVWTPRDFALREEVQLEGLREMVPAVRGMIAREAGKLGGRWDRVVLAGISMGAATGVHTLFNLDVPAEGGGRLAAFMGFCGRCPFAGRDLKGMREVLALPPAGEGTGTPVGGEDGVLRRTPVLLEHNVDDPLVLIENGRGLRDTLRGFGAQVEWREYAVGGHWFQAPEGIDDVIEFLNRVVLGREGGGGAGEGGQSQAVADSGAMEMDLS
ncbi:Alpha/Beta hydrolase protein [Parachaetomium inaequale]|uniref:Alpha/Beta hydrolase protein n=1 Tax=Parachaetomium inaequale TaxID=2588326 RepID=A0AAN6PRX8_9PEZI|nr:Alpha/Beta hydrolase protein [Parachaetomium inaequale]